ncbi:GrpB family protein [Klebsiella pneumoniae]
MRILTVVDYDEMWPTLFENERTLLQMTLGKVISRVHHIGSTSVPGLSAKPVIDILIEVANLEELDSLNQAMEGVGYTVRGENGILNRRYFTKGGNQRSHHIHAFTTGDAQIIKHLAFRDYLIKHNDVAIQYALMKKSAMLLCENDSHRYSIYILRYRLSDSSAPGYSCPVARTDDNVSADGCNGAA